MKTPKADPKDNPVLNLFLASLAQDVNLARIRFITEFVSALVLTRSVVFSKLAVVFSASAPTKTDSAYRRIQRFMAGYTLTDGAVCRVITDLLHTTASFDLVLDRTDWKIASFHLNVLALGIRYRGCAIPVLFSILPKKGASDTKQRIALVQRFMALYDKSRIKSISADREFIGKDWFKYLTDNKIPYYIRVKGSTLICFEDGKRVNARKLFKALQVGHFATRKAPVEVYGTTCFLSATRVKAQGGKTELLLVAALGNDCCPFSQYRERWQVETMFKAMKSSGFNINKTHLKHPERIENLFKLVMIAYCWCYRVGVYLSFGELPIKTKSHGRPGISVFRHGLQYVAKALLQKDYRLMFVGFDFLSCT